MITHQHNSDLFPGWKQLNTNGFSDGDQTWREKRLYIFIMVRRLHDAGLTLVRYKPSKANKNTVVKKETFD